MSDETLTITETVNQVTVTPVENTVEITTGISAASTTVAGIVQLTDSVSSTSTTTAATPNSVKSAYDSSLVKGVQVAARSGLYYRTPNPQYAINTVTHQRAYYTPIFISTLTTFDRIAINTASTFSGISTVRIGIYADSSGIPSTLILDAGTVAPTAASTSYAITINQTLATGFYWLAFCQQNTAPTVGTYIGNANSQSLGNLLLGSQGSVATGNIVAGYFQSSVTGAFANAESITLTTNSPYVFIRAE